MASVRQTRLVLFTLIALGAIGGGIYWVTLDQGTILSPGPLALVHAQYHNEPGCYECHTEGVADFQGLSDQQCLTCHETLDARIQNQSGYHAKVEGSCDACHSDHHGEDYRPIRWPPPSEPYVAAPRNSDEEDAANRDGFPHDDATGFALNGAHEELRCEQCHAINLVLDPAVVAFNRKPGVAETETGREGYFESYLGLQQVCGDCHHDPHVPSMGSACDDCHTEDAWTPSTNFVHEPPNTRYALKGKHSDVDCDACHITQPKVETPPPPPGIPTFEQVVSTKQPPVFRGVGFGQSPARPLKGETLPDCENCHGNVHRVSSETFWECKNCHQESGWKPWTEANFDHDTTGFRLEAGHAGVACDECHGKTEGSQGPLALPKREACNECHDDIHEGAFDREMAVAGKNCDQCHNVSDWKRPTYAKEDHPKQVPLVERHAAIRCEDCHGRSSKATCQLVAGSKPECTTGPPFARLPARGQVRVGPMEQECQSCHRDVHEGLLTSSQVKWNDCQDCHGLDAWRDAKFTQADHAAVGFPIRGAHQKSFDDCGGCHTGRSREGGLINVKIPNANQDCNACHREDDVHKGQLGNDCTSCHSEDSWAPSSFTIAQHQETAFPLSGAHMAVPCEICHETDPRTQVQKWKWQNTRCESCHKTPHGRQFRAQSCEECHTEQAWAPSSFTVADHAKTRFKLEGAHDTECSKCHQPDPGGRVVRYISLTRKCARCHEDVHLGQFTGRYGDCDSCHVEVSWKPSFFDHGKSRYKLDGAHRGVACDRCHQQVERQAPDGSTRQVAHYYPIPGRSCDDCHQNPHELGGGDGEAEPAEDEPDDSEPDGEDQD